MILSSNAGPALPHAFFTASHTSNANSGSVCENVSGLYSYRNWVPCFAVHSSVSLRTISVCFTASSTVCSFELWKTTVRNRQHVALYMWMIARFAPATDSTVRLMRSSRAGVRTFAQFHVSPHLRRWDRYEPMKR